MMRPLKNDLTFVKEVQRRGYVLETLDHSDEEVEDEANVLGDDEEDLEGKLLKVL